MSVLLQEVEPQPHDDLTLEQFQLMWGDKSGLTIEQQELVWSDVQEWYIDLPYHNFDHALETLWESMRLADLCEANGVPVNRKALVVGALFHDAGYFRDHEEQGFDTKEDYSAFLIAAFANRYEMDSDDLFTAQNAIVATTRGSKVYSVEDKILRRADLINISGRYTEDFLLKTRLFHKETEQLTGKSISVWDFATEAIKILSDYLDDDLSLGDFDNNSERMSVFQFQAVQNLKCLAREIAIETGQRIGDIAKKLGSRAVALLSLDRLN